MKNDIERYNNFFSQSSEHTYGKPADFLEKIYQLIESGDVLDLGAGDGRYALPLAEKGFNVTALDTSKVALDKLESFAKNKSLNITTEVVDLTDWKFDKDYDVILGVVIFQHLQKDDATRLLEEMKRHTKPGGMHALVYFTNEGDRYLLDREEDPDAFYPTNEWHKQFYSDWEEIYFKQKEAPLINKFHENGEQMKSTIQTLIVRKPVS